MQPPKAYKRPKKEEAHAKADGKDRQPLHKVQANEANDKGGAGNLLIQEEEKKEHVKAGSSVKVTLFGSANKKNNEA